MKSAALSPEQQELAATVRTLLDRHADSAGVREAAASGYADEVWRLLTEQIGAPALAIPEDRGGAGFSLFEAMIVLEEVGAALAPVPLLASVVATELLLALPPTDEISGLLERIASGAIATVAGAGDGITVDTSSIRVDEDRLSGTARNILDGAQAEILLIAASGEVFAVDPILVEWHPTPCLDVTTRLATVVLDGTPAVRLAPATAQALDHTAAVGAVGVAVLAAGCSRRGLRMTRDYVSERVQFGRPIGSFQAVKHRLADLLVRSETTWSVAMTAARACAEGTGDARELSAAAASYAKESVHAVAAETIQLHGGIAITAEHDAQLVFKRAHALGQLFGAAHLHRALLID